MRVRKSFVRFVMVGGLNTLIDLSAYALLYSLQHNILFANIISTSLALGFSFLMNRHFTFQAHGTELRQQLFRFVPVTLVGLWVVQSGLIYLFTTLNNHTHFLNLAYIVVPDNLPVEILGPKILAIGGSLAWNFIWYSKFVFADKDQSSYSKLPL
jgi:putative flippase GtrA